MRNTLVHWRWWRFLFVNERYGMDLVGPDFECCFVGLGNLNGPVKH